MSRECVLALDGGGTKIGALVTSLDGRVLGLAQRGAVNPNFTRPDTAERRLRRTIEDSLRAGPTSPDQVALVACSGPVDMRQVRSALQANGLRCPVCWVSEPLAALGLWPTEPVCAAVLLAGTGAVAWARGADGLETTIDGYGPWIGDDGSGHDIGVRAIRCVLQALDGRGEPTVLVEIFAQRLGLRDASSVVEAVHRGSLARRENTAGLAPLVTEAADQGDVVALNILRQAGADLAMSLVASLKGTGLLGVAVPVTCVGGVFRAGPYFIDAIAAHCRERSLAVRFVLPTVLPVVGVARRALAGVSPDVAAEALSVLARDTRLSAGLPERLLSGLPSVAGCPWLLERI